MVRFPTALGSCGISWSDVGITDVLLPNEPALGAATDSEAPVPDLAREAILGIQALLAGERPDLTAIALDPGSLDLFTRRVLDATRAVPAGGTTTYGAIARAVGTANDARAVGAALGRNPYPLLVPCHRVLAADGSLHGFSAPGGIETKRRILEIERAPGFDQPSLFA